MFKKFFKKLTRKERGAQKPQGRGLCRYRRKDFNCGGFGSAGAHIALRTSQNNRYGNRDYKGFRAV